MPRVVAHPTYPSVTEVLKAVGLTRGSEHIPDRYRERGRAMHELVAMELDELDASYCSADLQSGLDAFREFQEAEDYLSWHSELELVHPYGFVGHLDLVGVVGNAARSILDIKYTNSPDLKGAALQLAGYRLLWDHNYPEQKAERCLVLQLSPTSGQYKLHDVGDSGHGVQIFTAALMVFNAREGK